MGGNWIDTGRGFALIGSMAGLIFWSLHYGSRPTKRVNRERGSVDGVIRGYLKWSRQQEGARQWR